jgi:hypothetical protein
MMAVIFFFLNQSLDILNYFWQLLPQYSNVCIVFKLPTFRPDLELHLSLPLMFAASLAPDSLVQTRILSEAIQINRSFLVPSAVVGVYIISL